MNIQPNAVLFAAVCKRAGCAAPYAVDLGRALAEEFSKPLDAEQVRSVGLAAVYAHWSTAAK